MDLIEICYDGNRFTISDRDLESLRREIDDLVGQGGGWLDVSFGDGAAMPATLYVAAGIPVALIAPTAPEGPGDGTQGSDGSSVLGDPDLIAD